MEKTVHIEGMSCNHCRVAVEKALGALPGVESAQVDLEKKTAMVRGSGIVDAELENAVTEAGYEVRGIQ